MTQAQPDGLSDSSLSGNSTTFQFAPDRDTVVVDVVEAVSKMAGAEAMHFEPRLHDVIDPDALSRCVQSGEQVSVSFQMGEYDVTVRGCGEIEVAKS